MQDTKTKADINLIQFHKITSRHVLVLEADIGECNKRELLHMSNIIRIAGNELIAVMKKQYEQLLRTKRYRRLQDMYAKAKKADNKEQVNYPPLARAEVGASGLRPSFFLPMLHRQAPVFHRLGSIYR